LPSRTTPETVAGAAALPASEVAVIEIARTTRWSLLIINESGDPSASLA